MDSPTHYDNIVAPKAVDIGVAKVGPYWVMAVSYTHLDVYKRQEQRVSEK